MKALLLSILVKIKTMSMAAKVITSVATVIIVGGGRPPLLLLMTQKSERALGNPYGKRLSKK